MSLEKKFRDERGQALVEFALVLPVLATLLLAIAQFGILFTNYLALTDAVRVGAREAAVSRLARDPAAESEAAVRAAATNLDRTQLFVSISSRWRRGEPVTVSATYPYKINLLGAVVASGRLSSATTERVE